MKECKYRKIPPCYGSLERAIYEEAKKVNDEWKKSRAIHGNIIDKLRGKLMEGGFLDDTHDKVYELNKQMCDIGKTMNEPMKPLSEEAIQEIAKALEITRNPKGIIMEKKTKKMTKAEAFEYLKEKKVDASINEREVQLKLFSLGVVWYTLDSKPTLCVGYLLIDKECHMTHCGSDWDYYKTHHYEEISSDDILSIEIVDENKSEDEDILDEIVELGKKISCLLPKFSGHRHVVITETDVLLYDEGMCLFHSDPF
jgi:hypothetical protein